MAGTEFCWNKEIRRPHLPLLRSRKPPQLHMCRKAPQRSRGKGQHPIIGVVKLPTGFHARICLGKKRYVHILRRALGQVKCRKETRWLVKGKQTQNNYSYINDLTTSLLHSSSLGRMPTLTLSKCSFLSGFCLKPFLHVLFHLLCCVSHNKLCTCFCLLEKLVCVTI